jgi:hypothetical protein
VKTNSQTQDSYNLRAAVGAALWEESEGAIARGMERACGPSRVRIALFSYRSLSCQPLVLIASIIGATMPV